MFAVYVTLTLMYDMMMPVYSTSSSIQCFVPGSISNQSYLCHADHQACCNSTDTCTDYSPQCCCNVVKCGRGAGCIEGVTRCCGPEDGEGACCTANETCSIYGPLGPYCCLGFPCGNNGGCCNHVTTFCVDDRYCAEMCLTSEIPCRRFGYDETICCQADGEKCYTPDMEPPKCVAVPTTRIFQANIVLSGIGGFTVLVTIIRYVLNNCSLQNSISRYFGVSQSYNNYYSAEETYACNNILSHRLGNAQFTSLNALRRRCQGIMNGRPVISQILAECLAIGVGWSTYFSATPYDVQMVSLVFVGLRTWCMVVVAFELPVGSVTFHVLVTNVCALALVIVTFIHIAELNPLVPLGYCIVHICLVVSVLFFLVPLTPFVSVTLNDRLTELKGECMVVVFSTAGRNEAGGVTSGSLRNTETSSIVCDAYLRNGNRSSSTYYGSAS
eukprot:PhF_6_TR6867/c0_g1_i2/m.9885